MQRTIEMIILGKRTFPNIIRNSPEPLMMIRKTTILMTVTMSNLVVAAVRELSAATRRTVLYPHFLLELVEILR